MTVNNLHIKCVIDVTNLRKCVTLHIMEIFIFAK